MYYPNFNQKERDNYVAIFYVISVDSDCSLTRS